jgi:hypothetical protein
MPSSAPCSTLGAYSVCNSMVLVCVAAAAAAAVPYKSYGFGIYESYRDVSGPTKDGACRTVSNKKCRGRKRRVGKGPL